MSYCLQQLHRLPKETKLFKRFFVYDYPLASISISLDFYSNANRLIIERGILRNRKSDHTALQLDDFAAEYESVISRLHLIAALIDLALLVLQEEQWRETGKRPVPSRREDWSGI
jgi:hypothetical protein